MLDPFPRHILQELSWSVIQRQIVWEGLKSLLQQNWWKEWELELSCVVIQWLGVLNLLLARFLEWSYLGLVQQLGQLYFPLDHCHILPLEFSFLAFFSLIFWSVGSQVPTGCDKARCRTCVLAKGGQPFLPNTVRHKCYRCWRNQLWNLIFLCFLGHLLEVHLEGRTPEQKSHKIKF